MKLSTAFMLLCWLAAPMEAQTAAPPLTPHQAWALTEAQRAGAFYTPKVDTQPSFTVTLQAILGQESSWCVDKHRRDPLSWGCGQLTVSTAQLFDASATAQKLLHRDRYNIWLSAAYLAYCHKHGVSWDAMVRCYHGRKAKDGDAYLQAIRARIQTATEAQSDE